MLALLATRCGPRDRRGPVRNRQLNTTVDIPPVLLCPFRLNLATGVALTSGVVGLSVVGEPNLSVQVCEFPGPLAVPDGATEFLHRCGPFTDENGPDVAVMEDHVAGRASNTTAVASSAACRRRTVIFQFGQPTKYTT